MGAKIRNRKKGFLCLVLHAHLPYIRHPEYEYFLEENWLYEAITETYIPLLDKFEKLIHDDIDFRITLSLSPPLIEMLNDDLLRKRYQRHIERLLDLSEKDMYRTKNDIKIAPISKMYHKRFKRIHHLFNAVYKRDLVSAFKALKDSGKIELISSAATHAFLPNLSLYPQAVKSQIAIGAEHFKKNFKMHPKGIWLPECGFSKGLDSLIENAGIKFFFLDTHGVILGNPLPRYSVYAPITCPSKVIAFGRDLESSKQVWSSVEGYPGDFDYRDFYRDIGFDLALDYLKPYIHPDCIRTFTGIKYYRITGKTDKKEPYVINQALKKAIEHARHFILSKEQQIDYLSETLKVKPIITAMYDAELFGHWWFEGPEWIYALFRELSLRQVNFNTITPSEFLSSYAINPSQMQICQPSISSWGNKGYNKVWLNRTNDYIYRHLFKATERMINLAERFTQANGILHRALNQAVRELLLSQQSDWAFIMNNRTSTGYARKRFDQHIRIFTRLYQSILSDTISEPWLSEIEQRDRIFQDIDYRVYRQNNQL